MTTRELDSCAETGANEDETRTPALLEHRNAGQEPPGNAVPLAIVMREWLQDVGPDGAGVSDASDVSYRSLVEICKLTDSLASESNPFPAIALAKVFERVTSLESGGEERKVVNHKAIAKWLDARLESLRRYPKVVTLGWLPKVRNEGFAGGRGKTALFRFAYDRLELDAAAEPTGESSPSQFGGRIAYEASEPKLSLAGRAMFGRGVVPVRSVRGLTMLASAVASALFALLIGLLAVWTIVVSGAAQSSKALQLGAIALLEAGAVWYLGVRPWMVLVDDRIKMAEEIWTTFSQREAQVELLRREGRRHMRIVQYLSSCSICGSVVHVEPGGREFHGRLVGRCAESPREHVFSFDRVTKLGYPLRQLPDGYRG